MQIPIKTVDGKDEYFLITSRRKVSDWDRFMQGDTARRDFLRSINEKYGKGVYIYHVPRDLDYTDDNKIDLECADGLWNWSYGESMETEWGGTYSYIYRTSVDREHNDADNGGMNNVDGISASYTISSSVISNIFSIGKKHSCYTFGQDCNEATDKMWTNNNEVWTSWEYMGDRYDAWDKGYNEIFSPYSSPSTRAWDNSQTGIFIWIKSVNNNETTIDIFKPAEGIITEKQILEITPPSRPMGLNISYTECTNGVWHPILTWVHNTEPDMIYPYGNPAINSERYRIYRAQNEVNGIPGDYVQIADQYFRADQPPTYIDYSILEYCDESPHSDNIRCRYVVTSVDNPVNNTVFESVKSDFVATAAYVSNNDNFKHLSGSNIPKVFALFQNYPNPFNPFTKINYDIPKDNLVSIKIYDILGREIKTLVNEFKNAGSYIVSFNGSEFASGVYFYRIVAGNFVSVKRMVLIK